MFGGVLFDTMKWSRIQECARTAVREAGVISWSIRIRGAVVGEGKRVER
jgi:hypothetical protein